VVRGRKGQRGGAAPGCLMVLGRTQLSRSSSSEWSRGQVDTAAEPGSGPDVVNGPGCGLVARSGLDVVGGPGCRVGWWDRVDLGHQIGSVDIWSDVHAPQKVFTVAGSAPLARDVAGLVRMLAGAVQLRWAETPSGGLGPEIAGLRPPFPVSGSRESHGIPGCGPNRSHAGQHRRRRNLVHLVGSWCIWPDVPGPGLVSEVHAIAPNHPDPRSVTGST
jgi:hypothetical protein